MTMRGYTAGDRVGARDPRESGPLEHGTSSDEGHGLVDPLAGVVGRVALDDRRAVLPGVVDRALDEGMGEAALAVSRPNPDAPERPDRHIVDVRDLAGVRDRMQLHSRRDAGPADHLAVETREHTGGDIPCTQLADLVGTLHTSERTVLPPAQPPRQAPAHRRLRILRGEHRRHAIEIPCRPNLDHPRHLLAPSFQSNRTDERAAGRVGTLEVAETVEAHRPERTP